MGSVRGWLGCVFPHNAADGADGGWLGCVFPHNAADGVGRGWLGCVSRTTLRMGSVRGWSGCVFQHNAADGGRYRAGRAAFSRTTLRWGWRWLGCVFPHNAADGVGEGLFELRSRTTLRMGRVGGWLGSVFPHNAAYGACGWLVGVRFPAQRCRWGPSVAGRAVTPPGCRPVSTGIWYAEAPSTGFRVPETM